MKLAVAWDDANSDAEPVAVDAAFSVVTVVVVFAVGVVDDANGMHMNIVAYVHLANHVMNISELSANLPFLSHENGSLGIFGRLDKLGRVGMVVADDNFAVDVTVFVSAAVVVIVAAVIVNVAANVDVVIMVELYGI